MRTYIGLDELVTELRAAVARANQSGLDPSMILRSLEQAEAIREIDDGSPHRQRTLREHLRPFVFSMTFNRLVVDEPGLDVNDAVDRCRALKDCIEGDGNEVSVSRDVLDLFDELTFQFERITQHLTSGLDDRQVLGAVGQLESATARAAEYNINVSRHLELCRRVNVFYTKRELEDRIEELDGGNHPPDDEEGFEDHQGFLERCEELGVDVTPLEDALSLARHLRYCWSRGIDPEEDSCIEQSPSQPPHPDPLSINCEPQCPPSSSISVSASADRVEEVDPEPTTPTVTSNSTIHPLIVAHFKHLGDVLGKGDGGDALHKILWSLIALDERARVRLEGSQLALIEHLGRVGALAEPPCERAARAAVRKLLASSPLVEHPARRSWVFRLDQLGNPSVAFLAAIEDKEPLL